MRSLALIFQIAISATLGGCIIVPIPTPEMGPALITKEQIKRVKAGVGSLTREQVVAVIGEPQESYADDQVVLYEWERAQGMYLFAPAAGSGDITVGTSEHRICIKYSSTGVLQRFEHLDSIFGRDAAANRLIRDWVQEIGGWPAWYPVLWDDRERHPGIDHVTLNPGTGGPAIVGDTSFEGFVAILGKPYRAFRKETLLLYQSSDAKYFEPAVGTGFEIEGYDGRARGNRENYYALLAVFDSDRVLQNVQVVESWEANGPYQLTPIVADAFGVAEEELIFVRPFDGGYDGVLDGGVYVATSSFIGVASWQRNHYELVWQHPYTEISSISPQHYRSGVFWLERGVRIVVRLRDGTTIAIEPFEKDRESEVSVSREFAELTSSELQASG